MARWMSIGGTAATATLLMTTAVFADVSAQTVWDQWRTYMESVGYEVSTGSIDNSGGTLTVSDMQAGFSIPEADDGGAMTLTMSAITFTERGDGSVEINVPDEYPIEILAGGSGESLDMELTVQNTGMTIIASGDENETEYSFVVAEMKIDTTRFLVDDHPVDGNISAALKGYTGNYLFSVGDQTALSGSARMDAMAVAVSINEAEEDVVVDIAVNAKDMAGQLEMTLPETFDQIDMNANIRSGLDMEGTYSAGEMTMTLAGSGDGESFDMNGTFDSAAVDFGLSEGGFKIGELVTGADVTISGSEIPLPQINIKAQEYGFNLLMPVVQSDDPEDFELGMKIVDLEIQEDIWAMADPTGALPHDPATVIFDTSGKANWFFDLFDPDAQKAMDASGETPGELHAITLSELQVRAAGAELSGTGDFTFDNSDTTTFDGIPRPTGAIDLKLIGANALLDKLVQMGLIPDDQAMGARMMMGLFAVPGDGEDTLNSKIEINDQGHVMANGQRLR